MGGLIVSGPEMEGSGSPAWHLKTFKTACTPAGQFDMVEMISCERQVALILQRNNLNGKICVQ